MLTELLSANLNYLLKPINLFINNDKIIKLKK